MKKNNKTIILVLNTLLSGDQSISLLYDSIWLLLQSCYNKKLRPYIILAAFTNFSRSFDHSKYTILLDRSVTRLLIFKMILVSNKLNHYSSIFFTILSYFTMKNYGEGNIKRLYHHNFHYCGYISLSLLNNESKITMLMESIIYWIGAFVNKSQYSAIYPLYKMFYCSIENMEV